jgi:hypothetical protein
MVGRQAARSCGTVASEPANHVSPPTATGMKSLIMRSAMCDRGRNDSSRSPSRMPNGGVQLRSVHTTLPWLIIVPLGGPVVPLV